MVLTTEEELRPLMVAAMNGDGTSYHVLLREISARLRAYYRSKFARLGRSDVEAEDLVQEAIIAIHSRRHTYDVDLPLMPWIFAIAKYKLIDHLRASKVGLEVSLDVAANLAAKDEQGAVESHIDLNALMSTLPQNMREAIKLTKLDGLSIAEAARKSGRSESSLKVSVHRGLKAIAKTLSMRGVHENK